MKIKAEKQIKKNKKIDLDIKGLIKKFFTPADVEQTPEEIILADATLSDADKKELLSKLDDSEKLVNKMFRDYYKVMDVNVKKFKSKEETEQIKNVVKNEKITENKPKIQDEDELTK